MRNILLVTSLYPSDDFTLLNNTSVCHYFAKEWKNLGYNVRVIFLYNTYPKIYYPIIKYFRRLLASIGNRAVLDKQIDSLHSYSIDDIKITRIPIRKKRPGGSFREKELDKVKDEIISLIEKDKFSPDYIVGHFLHPTMEIIASLNEYYHVVATISLHGKETKYNSTVADLIKAFNYIGFRSIPIGRYFKNLYGEVPYFYCFSGIPTEYLRLNEREFNKRISRFIYVGALIKRKYPTAIISAVNKVYQHEDFSVTYVGDGQEKQKIQRYAKMLGIDNKIILKGHLKRDDVIRELDSAEVFIMISKRETFGLVYLEAMARGCIVVASKDEGMEGIIKHGYNGYLCNAGNPDALAKIIKEIKELPLDELNKISHAALLTAREMTDKKMAENYINVISS